MAIKAKSIVSGISVLGVTGIVCKLVGVLYSIPLAQILGPTGLGMFQTVFPTYNLLLTISSAGIPVAVSRMVSGYLATDDPKNAKNVFSVALKLLTVLGIAFSTLMLLSNRLLVNLVGVNESSGGFYAIAPCVAIVCVLSAFRGFIQGQQNMVPTAISQLIEQVGKVAFSLPLAAIGMQKSVADGAAGALLGITIVEFFALLYMIIRYFVKKKEFDAIPSLTKKEPVGGRSLCKKLITISIPITISACIIPLAQFVDSALMVKRMGVAGLDEATATALYGIFSGMVIRLINIPTALALAISMSLVPAISAVKARNDTQAIARESNNGIRYAFLIGFPCALGMSVLAKEILGFFYVDTLTAENLQTAAELLTFSGLTVVLFTVVQATTSILQALRKQNIPMITMAIGVAVKIVLNYTLIAIPEINIHGGPFASIACYSISMIPNLIFCCKYAEMKFNWKDWVLKPGIAALTMYLVVWGFKTILPFGRLTTILEVAIGIIVYVVVALAVKAITKEDLRSFSRKKA